MTVRINKQKINLREKLTEFEDKVNFDEVVRGLGEYTGNVGIGTTSPAAKLHIRNTLLGDTGMVIENTNNAQNLDIDFYSNVGVTQGRIRYQEGSGSFEINPNVSGDSPFTIAYGGNVGIGTTTPGTYKLNVKSTSTNQTCRVYRPLSTGGSRVFDIVSDYTGVVETVQFLVNTDGVTQNTSGTISQISSDERLKENISDATPKLQDLLKLKVKNFNFSDDENKTKYIGFIAQEMEEVFPSLVMTKDTREYDEDGNLLSGLEDSKSTKVSMDFAILTKAIQEQQSIIEDLKSRIETLESK